MWKKSLALLLVLAMLVGFSGNLAFTASAADIDGVAAIGGVGYPTLSAAVEAAADGDEIDLLTNVSENVTINKKDITLDLNGNTVTGQIYVTRGTGAYNSGTLNAVIKNGTVVATAEKPTAVYAYNTTTTLRDLTVTSAYGDAVYAGTSATVIEGKSTITSTAGNGIKVGFNLIIKGDDVTVTGSKYAICKDSSWVGSDTVTIEGGTFKGETQPALFVAGYPFVVTVSGGTFQSGTSTAVKVRNAKTTFSNANVEGIFYVDPSNTSVEVEINSGSYNGMTIQINNAANHENLAFTINGGTFKNALNLNDLGKLEGTELTGMVVNGGTFATNNVAAYVAEGSHCVPVASGETTVYEVAAHTFDKEVAAAEYLATYATAEAPATYYYSCVCGAKGTETFEYGSVAIATVNGVPYGSLAEAIAAAAKDETVVLQKSVEESVTINVPITLDLNGNTVTGQIYVATSSGSDNTIIKNGTVTCDAKVPVYIYNRPATLENLTITTNGDNTDAVNVSGPTTIKGKTNIYSANAIGINVYHKLTIEGNDVTVYGKKAAVQKTSASWTGIVAVETATINGGTYSSAIVWKPTANANGEAVALNVNGGTFATDMTQYCAEGYHTVDNGEGAYVYGAHAFNQEVATEEYVADAANAIYYYSCVCGAKGTETFEYGADAVATINGIPYNSVADAMAAAADGDEIILKKDVAEMIVINKKDITLNLNGKTVTGQVLACRGEGAYNSGLLNAVIKNGTVIATADTKTAAVYANNTSATLRDLTVTSAYGDAVNASGSSVIIEGKTTITSTVATGLQVAFNATVNGEDVTITGATFGIRKFGNWGGADVLTINGGTINGGSQPALYVDGNGDKIVTVNVNDADFNTTGSYTVKIRNGKATFNNVNVNKFFNVDPNAKVTEVTVNSGTYGALSTWVNQPSMLETFAIVINGGTFNDQNISLSNIADTELAGLTVNGGTWSKDMTAYCDESKHCVAVPSGETTVYEVAAHTFDQEVVSAEHLAASATVETPASYFYSCVCGANGTETFEYGSVAIATINGVAYGSLAEAVAAAAKDETVVLQTSVEESIVIYVPITLDLNGNTVTGQIKTETPNGSDNTIIKNGTVTFDAKSPVWVYNRPATLEDVKIITEGEKVAALDASGPTTIKGKTDISSANGIGIEVNYKITVEGDDVVVYGKNAAVRKVNGPWVGVAAAVISTINGGSFSCAKEGEAAIVWQSMANGSGVISALVINNGTFNGGKSALHIRNGIATVNNGTFNAGILINATSTSSENIDVEINGGDLSLFYIYAGSDIGPNLETFNVEFNGGVVTGLIYTNVIGLVEQGALTVSGGTFSKTMSKYCVTGHTVPVTTVEGEGEEAVETTVYVYVDEEHTFDQQVVDYDYAVGDDPCSATEFYVTCVCETTCEETFTAEALGHSFAENAVMDCETAAVCEICGTEVFGAHVEETIDAVLPTCTTSGWTEGKKCSVCDAILEAPEEVGALEEHKVIDAVQENKVEPTCTTFGSYELVKVCEFCGKLEETRRTVELPPLSHDYSYANITDETHDKVCSVGGETATEEHAYTDGFCVCGAEEPKAGCEAGVHTYTNAADAICNLCGERREDYTALTNANIKYTGNYLSFQEYIGMQPLVKTSLVSSYAKSYVKAVQTTAAGVLVKEENLALQYYSGTYSMVDMQVMAWDMTDNIKLTIVVEDADGVVTYGQTYSTSVEQLALEKLPGIKSQNNAKSEQQCRILVDMLNYGAAVQVAYSHNAESLPNTNLGEYAAYATTTTPEIAGAVTSTGSAASTIQDLGIYTTMQAQVELTMYIGLKTGAGDISDYELHITPEGGQTQILGSETFRMNGKYYVPVFALKAKDFRTNHTMQLVNKTTGQVVTKTYVASIEAKASAALSDATLGPVVVAMMKYGDAVAAYLAM